MPKVPQNSDALTSKAPADVASVFRNWPIVQYKMFLALSAGLLLPSEQGLPRLEIFRSSRLPDTRVRVREKTGPCGCNLLEARKYVQPKVVCATKIVRVYCTSASLSRMLAHVRTRSFSLSLRRSRSATLVRAREFMRRFSSNEGPLSPSSSDSSRTGDDASSPVSRSSLSLRHAATLSARLPSSSSL